MIFFNKNKKIKQPFYIFFDVDGVLNKESDWINKFKIDENCVKVFSEILELFENPICIISSTWRAGISNNGNAIQYDHLEQILDKYYIKISGSTPISHKSRDAEILYYLRKYCNNTENYIILDDDKSLFINQDINLYLTNYKTGLIQEDINHIKHQIYHQKQKNEDNEREI